MSQDRSNSWSQILDTLEHILDRPIAFQPIFARIAGSINAGLFLSQAWYWQKITNRSEYEGWFYKTQAEWEEETLLTRREQETCRKILKELGVLEERRSGSPAKLFFRIRVEKLFLAASTYAQNRHSSMAANANQDCTQTPILDCTQTPISIRKQRLPETTSLEASSSAFALTAEVPSNGNGRQVKTGKKEPDPRHTPTKEFVSRCYIYLNPDARKCPWDDRDTVQFIRVLTRFKEETAEDFHQWLLSYASSENINPSDPPYKFLPKLEQYRSGPLNQYGKPFKPNGGSM